MRTLPALILACLLPVVGGAQIPDNASLNGKYYFVHLLALVNGVTGDASAQNLGGCITFDGNGGYTFDGELGTGSGAPASASGAGTYSVDANAFVTLTNPIADTLEINARLGANNEVLLGASTEASDGSYDLFVAIRSPGSGISDGVFSGAYTGATLMFPDGGEAGLKTALLSLSADGNGSFNSASATGHAADDQDNNVQQPISNATYSLTGDGSGTAAFGSSATLFSGNRRIFSSVDGNYVIGYSTEAGGREIFLATRNFGTSADDASWQNTFWMAEIVVDIDLVPGVNLYTSASGALRSTGAGQAAISQRVNFDQLLIDFSGVQCLRDQCRQHRLSGRVARPRCGEYGDRRSEEHSVSRYRGVGFAAPTRRAEWTGAPSFRRRPGRLARPVFSLPWHFLRSTHARNHGERCVSFTARGPECRVFRSHDVPHLGRHPGITVRLRPGPFELTSLRYPSPDALERCDRHD